MFPNLTTIRHQITRSSWYSSIDDRPRRNSHAPTTLESAPASPPITVPDRRAHTPEDFGAPPQEAGRSFHAVLEFVCRQGLAGKSGWTAQAVEACRRCHGRERTLLLHAMARNGFTPTEAAEAGLYFSGRALAQALVRFTQEGNTPWKTYLIHEISTGLHFMHRHIGHRELDAALTRGDVPIAEALHAAGYHHTRQPWAAYFASANTGDTHVIRAAVAAGIRFDDRHQNYAEIAARRGNLEFVRCLHENGMPLGRNRQANPILHHAVMSGNRDLVAYVITRGGHVNLHDIAAQPPHTIMETALARRDLEMARLLRDHGYQLHDPERQEYDRLLREVDERRRHLRHA